MTISFESPIFPATYTFISGRSSCQRHASFALSRRGTAVLRELGITLNGVVAGSTAQVTRSRIEANSELGGDRTIETETDINRVTAAADQTELNDNLFDYGTFNSNPPADANGNPLGEPGLR